MKNFPDLMESLLNFSEPLNYFQAFNSDVQKFLKTNSYKLLTIMNIINEPSPYSSPKVLSPDGREFDFMEASGTLKPGVNMEIIEILDTHPQFRHEITDYGEKNSKNPRIEIFFDFIVPRYEGVDDQNEKTHYSPHSLEKLLTQPVRGFFKQILSHTQKTLIINKTRFDLDRPEQAMDNIETSSLVIGGSLKLVDTTLSLTAYSKESMDQLYKIVQNLLKTFIISLLPPKSSNLKNPENSKSIIYPYPSTSTNADDDLDLEEFDDEKEQIDQEAFDEDSFNKENPIDFIPSPISISASSSTKEFNFSENSSDSLTSHEKDHIINRMMRHQMVKWLNKPLPILNNKSPRESVSDPMLRAKLIELIKDSEQQDDRNGIYDEANSLWKQLNLKF
jgi:hypothetical protein